MALRPCKHGCVGGVISRSKWSENADGMVLENRDCPEHGKTARRRKSKAMGVRLVMARNLARRVL